MTGVPDKRWLENLKGVVSVRDVVQDIRHNFVPTYQVRAPRPRARARARGAAASVSGCAVVAASARCRPRAQDYVVQRGPDAPPERVRVKTYLAGNLDRLPDVGLGGAQATATTEGSEAAAAAGRAGGAGEERGEAGDDARDAGADLAFDHGASTSCMWRARRG